MATDRSPLIPLLLCALSLVTLGEPPRQNTNTPQKRFEYKFSFKGPYLAQKDNSVPFFEYFGNAIASEESVRITPSLKSQRGSIWTKNQASFANWEVELVFRVTGRGRVGADGLAFWFVENKGVDGPVFGAPDYWKGLGVFFDSFDNDNKKNNPYIMGIVNDGTFAYNHAGDGKDQQLGGCMRDYRNKPFPVRAKIQFYQGVLTVWFNNGVTNDERAYELCFRHEAVHLPPAGYFGISAATGGLADDHDVLKFLTYSLYSPDQVRDEDDWFEEETTRELRQIFAGQSEMFGVLRRVQNRIEELAAKTERAIASGAYGGGQPVSPGGTQQGVPPADSIRRHEVDQILNTQRELAQLGRDVKAYVTDIHQKSATILNGVQQKQGQGQGGIMSTEISGSLAEIKAMVTSLKKDGKKSGRDSDCPTCIPPSLFFITVFLQLAIILGYHKFRESKEAQAKKFF
ncbi:unnamed protein product [Cyprideis torosa]|uniref:Uncharacterized protein n=1 Tax=Cyprideis torosa TaxID=163714 RepID=A0A7R8ZS61_9CRUS|nr:unnamed protein product [Cyprideis torosa]CAG0894759.1 unnamed protein product [Cyprideis torosa]